MGRVYYPIVMTNLYQACHRSFPVIGGSVGRLASKTFPAWVHIFWKRGPMLYLDYEFTAVHFSSRKITLCIIPYGAPVDTTPEKVTEIWDDILMCFIQGRFYAVAHILNTLPYQRDYAGTFEIMGPLSKRKEIFHLLTPYRDKAPNISLAIRVKFFRFPKATDLTVEHWIGRTWKVRQGDIPPRPCKKKEDTFTS